MARLIFEVWVSKNTAIESEAGKVRKLVADPIEQPGDDVLRWHIELGDVRRKRNAATWVATRLRLGLGADGARANGDGIGPDGFVGAGHWLSRAYHFGTIRSSAHKYVVRVSTVKCVTRET